MFWWTLLWLLVGLTWSGACFRAGWNARGTMEFHKFLAKLNNPWRRDDDPPPPAGTLAR